MDTPSLPPAPQLDLRDTFGALLIAVVISSCLYGVTCLQAWYYFRNYSDRLLLRGVVLAILILETIHVMLAFHIAYHYLVLNFGNPAGLLKISWTAIVTVPVTTATTTIVHLFYAARIYRLSHKRDWWTPTIICMLKIAQIGGALEALSTGLTIRIAHTPFFEPIANNKQVMMMGIAALSVGAIEDVICTFALSYYLHKSRSGIHHTDTLINRLIIHSVNNGALTSLASISVVSVMIPRPKNLVYFAIFTIVCNLYANSLLSTQVPQYRHITLTHGFFLD
ncbi:hypothetical protein Moror_817 [Moniliophthora roreri MCA 2997]|uniref:DUF6534 domain-containing protein n=1 Tax=Moniliophthora roreri (strain MCA 2997) TaxID=1381753 RepID=V2X822_MONRO|nr:hypothetical protein Moror_817 [Moniliophthora roreri MCA 2997]